MRWPFRRDKNVASVPQEIQEYYQTEKRERTGVAWLLALGTLLITIGLSVLLFFGGRWAYRQIAGNDNEKTPETSQVAQNPSEGQELEGSTESNGDSSGQTQGAASDTEEGRTSSASTDQPNSPSAASGQTQGAAQASDLPNTGPADTAILALATVVIAATAHYTVTSRK